MPMYEATVRTPQGEEKKRIYADTPQEAKKTFRATVWWSKSCSLCPSYDTKLISECSAVW